MIEHVLVWFLLFKNDSYPSQIPVQLGPYSTLQDCQRVQGSVIFKSVTAPMTQCINVQIPIAVPKLTQETKK